MKSKLKNFLSGQKRKDFWLPANNWPLEISSIAQIPLIIIWRWRIGRDLLHYWGNFINLEKIFLPNAINIFKITILNKLKAKYLSTFVVQLVRYFKDRTYSPLKGDILSSWKSSQNLSSLILNSINLLNKEIHEYYKQLENYFLQNLYQVSSKTGCCSHAYLPH